jgi:hypothetical protein
LSGDAVNGSLDLCSQLFKPNLSDFGMNIREILVLKEKLIFHGEENWDSNPVGSQQ